MAKKAKKAKKVKKAKKAKRRSNFSARVEPRSARAPGAIRAVSSKAAGLKPAFCF